LKGKVNQKNVFLSTLKVFKNFYFEKLTVKLNNESAKSLKIDLKLSKIVSKFFGRNGLTPTRY